MSNGDSAAFRELLLPRLEATSRDEASTLVLEAYRAGEDLGTVVIDVIQVLPAQKTRRLRNWVDQATDYVDWIALERQGWEIERFWQGPFAPRDGRFAVFTPGDEDIRNIMSILPALAAAVGAWDLSYIGPNKRIREGRTAWIFGVNKTI
ncbi:MAG TPA: hypothetical protein VFA98_12740 [Thermoanaerobaculia bacterium]|jgi:hypothetical protein|nr:hypothetical protein [Thermoanaerobaculia bacterium]